MRNARCKSCSLRAACRNGIPPSLPMCRAMASSSINEDRFLLLSQHELVLASFLNFIQLPQSRNQHSARGTSPHRMRWQHEYLPPLTADIPQESLRLSFRLPENQE